MRKFMKGFTDRFTKKQIRRSIVIIISLLLFCILQILSIHIKNSLTTQQMASRWDNTGKSAQVSCFISENTQITPQQITNLEHAADAALADVSITNENKNARLWVDAYSARGEITVENEKNSVEATAIGVGGDFFLFHPLKLISGSYFSDDDLMQDYIVIDEDAAWQLFGSNDVVGMKVTINGVPHIIRGVIQRDTGKMNKKAGNDKTTFYVSYDSLSKYGTLEGINTFEIVMPNPISGFALTTIKDKIGVDESKIELVENSKRYSILSLLNVFSEFGTRSMNQKAVVYPYWENVARGYEDILSLILICKIIFLLIPAVIALLYLCYRFKHRTWNIKSLFESGSKWINKMIEKYKHREKENNRKIKLPFHWNDKKKRSK